MITIQTLMACLILWHPNKTCSISHLWTQAQMFINMRSHTKNIVCQNIENTRWVFFEIKFTRQGFENACWHREACRAIQHAFSKPSLVNLISKDANLVFNLSVYPLLNTLQTCDYDVFFLFLCWFSVISDVTQNVQRHHDLIKATCREIDNVYQATHNNAVYMGVDW